MITPSYWCFLRIIMNAKRRVFTPDVKTMDPERHRRFVGQDNALILENARKLAASGANIVIRMPVIPGVNDTSESIDAVATSMKIPSPP